MNLTAEWTGRIGSLLGWGVIAGLVLVWLWMARLVFRAGQTGVAPSSVLISVGTLMALGYFLVGHWAAAVAATFVLGYAAGRLARSRSLT